MIHESNPTESAEEALSLLKLKGTRILELCLELRKDLCVKGFIDAQIELGSERLPVIEAMRSHITAELATAGQGARRRLLEEIRSYIDQRLQAALVEESADVG